MIRIVVATRSAHKLRELQQLLGSIEGIELIDLDGAGIERSADEETIEIHDSFEANALAKARYYSARTPHPVLADDSGLSVDALGGEPGVRSKRFSGRTELSGDELDAANNLHLLERLRDVPDAHRGAHYTCCLAIVTSDGGSEKVFFGRVDGVILREPAGSGGFGYDPLFFVPELGGTFAELPAAEKQRSSHRARAVEAARPELLRLAAAAC